MNWSAANPVALVRVIGMVATAPAEAVTEPNVTVAVCAWMVGNARKNSTAALALVWKIGETVITLS